MMTYLSPSNAASRLRLAAISAALLLGGCTSSNFGSDAALGMYIDPSRYDLYNCAQLRTAKRYYQKSIGDYEALMAKARAGAGGSVVAEVAYRNDYNSARANYNLADKVWQRNNCENERLPQEKIAAPGKPEPRDPLLPPAPYEDRQPSR